MKKTISLVLFSAFVGSLSVSAAVDCIALSLAVKNSVTAEQSKVLEIVSAEVSAAPSCACEIVKAAIEASKANVQTIASIVEAASIAAPEQMRLVSQCAVAVAPDALEAVQAVIAKLDPNSGKPAAKSAKDVQDSKAPLGEVAEMPNPLDFPGQGPIGTPPGIDPGQLLPRFTTPPAYFVSPPKVTDTDPSHSKPPHPSHPPTH
jgi:hypothetical protein